MQIDIQEIMEEVGVQEDYEQTYKKLQDRLDLIAIDIVRANESREEIHIIPVTPFYGHNRQKLEFITVEPITIDRLPTVISFNDTWQQNLQPFIKGSEAREDHKKAIRELMQFTYNVDLRVTNQEHSKTNDTTELLYSNFEFMFLYHLALKIVGNISRVMTIMLMEKKG